jgi:aspartate aminotransferase
MAAETGLHFTWNEIIMSVGAGGGLSIALKTLINHGQEVIVFSPYFPEYLLYIAGHWGVTRVVPTDSNFSPDLKAFEKAITRKTKVVLMNSPNNPSGAVYNENTLEQMGKIIREKESRFGTKIFILNDEPYRKIVYDGRKCPYIFGFHPRTISVTSHSKDLSIPGERIGYVAVNPQCNENGELGTAIGFCNRAIGVVNAPALMQKAVSKLQRELINTEIYQKQRDFLYDNLTSMGYSIVKPAGTFYMYPKSPVDDLEFTDELRNQMVLTVAGIAFGTPGYFRIAFCVEDWVLEGSLNGFKAAANKYGLC